MAGAIRSKRELPKFSQEEIDVKIRNCLEVAKASFDDGIKKTQKLRIIVEGYSKAGKDLTKEKFSLCKYLIITFYTTEWREILRSFDFSTEEIQTLYETCVLLNQGDRVPAIKGDFVVLLGNPNLHNYPIGVPLRILHGGEHAETSDHYRGNCLPSFAKFTRAATDEEIALFIAEEYMKVLQKENFVSKKNGEDFIRKAIEMFSKPKPKAKRNPKKEI